MHDAHDTDIERLWLVSDFNLANLARLLENRVNGPPIEPVLAPFGNAVQVLTGVGVGQAEAGALIWTQPEALLPSFRSVLEHRRASAEQLRDEVDAYTEVLQQARQHFRFLLVPTWIPRGRPRGLGMLDFRSDAGIASTLMTANARLVQNLHEAPETFVLDATRWLGGSDPDEATRSWYLGKMPFATETFRRAADDIAAAVDGLRGAARKVVVLDLDDTIWGGIVGDVGWEGLRLGGHDPIGEAYVDFQRALKALTNRGIILAIASKNEESVALNAIARHPEMVLRPDDFAARRINWRDKAQNIVDLAQELNLGLDSLVFLDDNPSERARVRAALPAVLVPAWPRDPLLFAEALRALGCFDAPTLSDEDVARARMYAAERQRQDARQLVASAQDWLRTLDIQVRVRPLDRANLPRATQLLNKTNQMNLSTRRMTESELWEWTAGARRALWTIRVSDRFGDYGLTGLVSTQLERHRCRIVDFVLSCRVFGRDVEETMVHVAVEHARSEGSHEVIADFVPTPKNRPCLTFWRERSGFCEQSGTGRFVCQVTETRCSVPENVKLLQEVVRS